MNHKSPKDPKLILILTIKLLYTHFWKKLPIGGLIWLKRIWLIWAQIMQPTSNHLKSKSFGKRKQPKPEQAKSEQAKSEQPKSETQIRATQISPNHRKLHGAIFSSVLMLCETAGP